MRKHLAILLGTAIAFACPSHAERQLVIVTGAGGEPEYTARFQRQADAWETVGENAGMSVQRLRETDDSRAQLQSALTSLPKDGDDLWLVMVGHGTFDGRNAKFNLSGDDVSAKELADWLKPFSRRVVVLALFSASGPFVPELSGPNRVVLAATRSGGERNYSRLGEKFPESLTAADADLDGDGSPSLLEIAIHATDTVTTSYEDEQRIVTEHAILDDNGDGLGTEVRELARTIDPERDGRVAAEIGFTDGSLAPAFTPAEILAREKIEAEISALRAGKSDMREDVYFDQLERCLLQMAELYATARKRIAVEPD